MSVRLIKQIASTVFYVCGLNFIVFSIISMRLGGTASLGKVEGGKYYVGDHGQHTEVSESVYRYSLQHGRSTHVTHPLALLAGGVVLWAQLKLNQKKSASEE